MTIADRMLAEFEGELRATRACLERLPDDKLGWQPHARSMTLGQLALHIATAQAYLFEMSKSDLESLPRFEGGPPQPNTTAEVLAAMDSTAARLRAELPLVTDDEMGQIWNMSNEGRVLLSLPRSHMLRSIMLNHIYHHRGQLSVYMRLLDIPVPSIYGPSADEPPAFMQG